MFFLLIAANLAVYLSSLQFLGSGRLALGGLTFAGGMVMTSLSVMYYQLKKIKKLKKVKKLVPDCDCDCDCLPETDCDCFECECGD